MKAFSERNPITIAVVGLIVLAGAGTATYYANDLPIIGGGTDYSADFSDAAGLRSGDDVRVAGVKVGTVDSIDLVKDHVHVSFRVKDHAWVSDQSKVEIKIKTLLGQEYLEIDNPPAGDPSTPVDQAQPAGRTIPLTRTITPMNVAEALSRLSDTTGAIDTQQLARSFDALSAAFAGTPASVHSMLTGLTRLSRTIASRDGELKQLAEQAAELTGTLAADNDRFAALIRDGRLLVGELDARSAAITALLNGTREFARQLATLVTGNEGPIRTALTQLGKVTDILVANKGNLDNALRLIGPYYTLINNAAGNGPWIDIYICGLFDNTGAPIVDSNVSRTCQPKPGTP